MSSESNVQFSVLKDDTRNGGRQNLVRKHRITIAIICVAFLVVMLWVIDHYEWTAKRGQNNTPVATNKEHQNRSSEAPFKILEHSTTSTSATTEESVTNLNQIPKLQLTNFTLQDGQMYHILSYATGKAIYPVGDLVLSEPLTVANEQKYHLKSTGVTNHYNILSFDNRPMTYFFTDPFLMAKFRNANLTDGNLKQEWIVERDRDNVFLIKSAFKPGLCFVNNWGFKTYFTFTNISPCRDHPNVRGWVFLKICDS